MSDNKQQRGSPDNEPIGIHDPNEVRHWTKSLDVSLEELEAAVRRALRGACF